MEEYYKEKGKKLRKIKTIKTFFMKIIYIVILLIIIWNLIIVVKTLNNPNEIPSVFGIKTFYIVSKSMEPEIRINDIVIMKEVEQHEIDKGDIITFIQKGEIITHRVISIEERNGKLVYTTQGDANNIEDFSKITFENIEGKYIGKISKVGKIILALKNKFIFAGVLIVLIFIYLIKQKINRRKFQRSITRNEYESKKNNTSS